MIVTLAICKLQKLQRWEVNRRVCVCVLWSREGERVKGFKGSRVQGFKGSRVQGRGPIKGAAVVASRVQYNDDNKPRDGNSTIVCMDIVYWHCTMYVLYHE